MAPSRDRVSIDEEFRAADLEPVAPYTRVADERSCRCTKCGTLRHVRLSTLRKGGAACRWCSGWAKWTPWAERARATASTWRSLGAPEDALARLQAENLAPLTPVGDLYQPVGVVCLVCGETFVTVPERLDKRHAGWFGCERCAADHRRQVRAGAAELFAANGLRLAGACGEYTPVACVCMACGSERRVALDDLRQGTAPLCWTCTHGIRADEPHRVYLFHFPALRVMKVGLTHNRHDRRLFDHVLNGGVVVDTVVVPDRESARRLETLLKARYEAWATADVGPADFPQGGWTETWRDDAPLPDLAAEAVAASIGTP
jgi:hypothetical protein